MSQIFNFILFGTFITVDEDYNDYFYYYDNNNNNNNNEKLNDDDDHSNENSNSEINNQVNFLEDNEIIIDIGVGWLGK